MFEATHAYRVVRALALGGFTVFAPACGSSDQSSGMLSSDDPSLAIRLNEVMPLSSNDLDWIELYNPRPVDTSLEGYYLSDSDGDPFKCRIPNGLLIPGEGFVRVMATGDPSSAADHVDFKLSSEGESIWLTSPDGKIADSVTYGPRPSGDHTSFSRCPDGEGSGDSGAWSWRLEMTPEAPNDCDG